MMINAVIVISTRYAGGAIMNKKTIVLLVVAILSISSVLLYLALPHIYIAMFAKNHDLNISYRGVRFTPHIGAKNTGGLTIDIYLRDVRISKKGTVAETYENLGALISAPFDGTLKYREINGVVRPLPGRILIDNLTADGEDIKVTLKGVFFYTEDRADLDVVIQFSQNLLKKIPKELSDTILKESADGWKSLSIKLKGSFKSPAIELTGKLFRLSIKEISGT